MFTNRTPTDAYRGAGRPEATYAIERIMDTLGRRVGKDAADIRRLNLIPPFDEPRPTAGGLNFDSGNYEATLDRALDLAGWDDLRARQGGVDGGKRLGVGISTYIEMCGLAPSQVLAALKIRRRRVGRRDDPLPPDREGHGRDGHLAARAGPRDVVGPDRRGRAGRPVRGRRGAPRRHRRLSAGDGHVRLTLAFRRRHRALARRAADQGEGDEDRRPRARGGGRGPRMDEWPAAGTRRP